MTDPPLPPALGIEGVEWLSVEGAETLTVLVTGRWRRRRPTWSGQPLLVIESGGHRHRFPAIAEPPRLTGTAPGTWRMSFSVPASLRPDPGSRGWLQLGAVVVPLPVEPEHRGHRDPEPAPFGEMRVEANELALRVRQLERELERARSEPAWFAARLAEAERAVRAAEQIAHSERMRRLELEHELDLQHGDLGEVEALRAEIADTLERIEELQRAHERQGRLIAEAEHAAAVARAAREEALAARDEAFAAREGARARAIRSELELASRSPPVPVSQPPPAPELAPGLPRLLDAERRVAASRGAVAAVVDLQDELERVRVSLSEAERRRAQAEADRAQAVVTLSESEAARAEAAAALSRSEAARADAHCARADAERARADTEAKRADSEATRADSEAARAHDIARAALLEQQLHDQAMRTARAYAAIERLRGEVAEVRAALAAVREPDPVAEPEPVGEPEPVAAPEPVAEPDPVAGPEPVGEPESDEAGAPSDRPVEPVEPSEPRGGPIDAERLESALTRLREAAPALVPEVEASVSPASLPSPQRPWLRPVFRTMVRRDPAGAGRLVVALLPAQPLAQPLPLAYDLVLADFGCVAVTTAAGTALVELRDAPRSQSEVQLQVHGELASLARLLAAGPVRRRLRRGLALSKGDRRTAAALRALVRTPLSLEQMAAAGVRPEPVLALSLIAAMIEPSWTAGEHFTIEHREPAASGAGACLRIRDGEPAAVGNAVVEGGQVTTTIVCPAPSLLAVLGAGEEAHIEIEGDERPVSVLRSWMKRAQSG